MRFDERRTAGAFTADQVRECEGNGRSAMMMGGKKKRSSDDGSKIGKYIKSPAMRIIPLPLSRLSFPVKV
jgi:hypothetical protein